MKLKREKSETRYRIMQAMLQLGRTTPVGQITVQDVCAACQLSRKTFYNYFSGKYDLIQEIYRDWVARSNLAAESLDDSSAIEQLRASFRSWAAFFQENSAFISSTYDTEQWNLLEEVFYRQTLDTILADMALYLGISREEIPDRLVRLARFYGYGITGLLLGWAIRNCPEPPEEIVDAILAATPFRMLRWYRDREKVQSWKEERAVRWISGETTP